MIRSSEFNLQSIADNTSADLNNILAFVKWCCSSSDVAEYMDTIHGQGTLGQISSKNPRVAQMAFDTYDRIWEEYTLHNQSNYIRRLILSSDNPLTYMQMFYSSVPDRTDAASLIASQDFFIPLYEASSFQWNGLVQNPFNKISKDYIIPVGSPHLQRRKQSDYRLALCRGFLRAYHKSFKSLSIGIRQPPLPYHWRKELSLQKRRVDRIAI